MRVSENMTNLPGCRKKILTGRIELKLFGVSKLSALANTCECIPDLEDVFLFFYPLHTVQRRGLV